MLPQPPAATAVAADNLGGPSIEAVEQALRQMELNVAQHAEQQQRQTSPASDAGEANISALFHKVAPPILQAPTPPPTKAPTPPAPTRRRQRRTFNMLSEFVAMFQGPLPADIIAGLTEIFNLDNEEIDAADDALLNLAGEGVEDLAGGEVQATA
ncbi:hypothetical protein BS78_03G156000 [Paspalum vaginatum]|nr:hypothetical protein BS78_03G156000 [Paspalum vaginatum]